MIYWWPSADRCKKKRATETIKFTLRQIVTSALALLIILMAHAAAQAPAVNIVAVGASNTWGWGVGRQRGYPEQLQAMLRARGYDAHVTNVGVIAATTAGMLRRIDKAVPEGTQIVILQPGSNDLRFFGTKEKRAANIAAIVSRLSARDIKVIVFDSELPAQYYQFDKIHFTSEGHRLIAEYLLAEVMAALEPAKQ
jgi:acyl-CoA thioesterase-1